MEIVTKPEKTHGPVAATLTLARYNASFATDVQRDINSFARTLADHHQELVMEEIDTEGETSVPKMKFEQPDMECPMCFKTAEDSTVLLGHVLSTHSCEKERSLYGRCGLISAEANELLIESMEIQSKQTMVKTKIENSNFTIACPINSPLSMYFSLRHLKIYLDFLPPIKCAKPRVIKIELERENRTYYLYFSWVNIDRACNRIKKAMTKKREKHLTRFYEQQCQNILPSNDDVVLKKNRTAEENNCLAKALNLSENFTQEELMDAIQKMETYKPKVPEFQLGYDAQQDQEGNTLNREQRKLISTLTNNQMFVPVDGKRRSCRKRQLVH